MVGVIQAILFCLVQIYEIIGLDDGDETAGSRDEVAGRQAMGIRSNRVLSQNESTGTTNETATATLGAAGPVVPFEDPGQHDVENDDDEDDDVYCNI